MLRALMLHGVGGEVDSADVIAVDQGGALEGAVELVEELVHPRYLGHTISHTVVFCLCAGAGDVGLTLGSPRDEVGAQEYGIAGGGPVHVGAANLVSVGVDHKFRRRGWSKEEVVVEGAQEVAQNPLESSEVGLPWCVHMKAHLLNGIGDVRPREGEVLEHICEALVRHRVGDWRPVILRELRLSVDRRGAGLVVEHASPLQNVDGVLTLVHEEMLGPTFGSDAKEVVERPQVLHRELPLERDDRALQEIGGGCHEHNVVDVEEVNDVLAPLVDEERCVRHGLDEADGDQMCGEAAVPGPRCLLEAVE
jgi:hypothetical protein